MWEGMALLRDAPTTAIGMRRIRSPHAGTPIVPRPAPTVLSAEDFLVEDLLAVAAPEAALVVVATYLQGDIDKEKYNQSVKTS